MSEQKTFQIALLISILTHSVFFFSIPHISFPSKKPTENLKISYYKIETKPEKKIVAKEKTEPVLKKLPDIKKEEISKPSAPIAEKPKTAKPKFKQIRAVENREEKKFENVVEEEKDDAKKATYINYYRAVREKIKQAADKNYFRYSGLVEGEVFLSFIVAQSGELLQVRVIDGKSVNDSVLRNIAINNVRDSSPFPPFPLGMDHYQITFNVIIEFER